MTHDATPRLDLLVPWDLPIEQKLDAAEQLKVTGALKQLLSALQQASNPQAIVILEQALLELGEAAESPAQLATTKTALQAWQVEDYDRYFGIGHVRSAEVAVCLVRGLLITYHRFLDMIDQDARFDPAYVAQQKQGFEQYVHLLCRVFQIHLEGHPFEEHQP